MQELTKSQREVFRYAVKGMKAKDIAALLFVETCTVRAHLTQIYRKCGVLGRTHLIIAYAQGKLELD